MDDDFLIMIPLFNDWVALCLLLMELETALSRSGRSACVLVVNDGSTEPDVGEPPMLPFRALHRIDVLELRSNLGHQRAIAIGLAYIEANLACRAVVLMDGDGEDAPADVPRLLDRFDKESEQKIVFAERRRRSESWLFVAFYVLYKGLHWVLTGFGVKVGNFSAHSPASPIEFGGRCGPRNHYAAAAFQSRQPYCTVPTIAPATPWSFTNELRQPCCAWSDAAPSLSTAILIGVRLLVGMLLLITIILVGIVATLASTFLTNLAIPVWATTTLGLSLNILLQAVLLSFPSFRFIILSGRRGSTFLPTRDYSYFITTVRPFETDCDSSRKMTVIGQPVQ